MGKGIGRIYKHIHINCPYPSPNTTFVIPKCPDPYIYNQRTSADSLGEHYLSSDVSYQSNIHHVNSDVNDSDGSQ